MTTPLELGHRYLSEQIGLEFPNQYYFRQRTTNRGEDYIIIMSDVMEAVIRVKDNKYTYNPFDYNTPSVWLVEKYNKCMKESNAQKNIK